VDLETRKRAVAELSRLKADMKRSGHVTAAEAASLRRSLAQREDELNRMRRASAEPPTPRVRPAHYDSDGCCLYHYSTLGSPSGQCTF